MIPSDIEKLKQTFGDREFTGKEAAETLGLNAKQHAGAMVNQLKGMRIAYKTTNGWRFGTKPVPFKTVEPTPTTIAPAVTSELACIHPSLMRISDFLLHERAIVLADARKIEGSDAIRLITPILEYDTTFRATRNKVLTFSKKDDPKEYAAIRVWLDGMAGSPPIVDETALELAADLEVKLNAANQEIAELKAKIESIRGMLRGEL